MFDISDWTGRCRILVVGLGRCLILIEVGGWTGRCLLLVDVGGWTGK